MKKIFSLILIMVFIASLSWADVTVTSNDVGKTSQGGSFIVNAYSANASGCEELKSTPGTGKAIYIKRIYINAVTPITVTIGEGETTPGSVDTTVLGPLTFGTGAGNFEANFYPELKLTNNKSLVVDSSATGDVCIIVEGYVE